MSFTQTAKKIAAVTTILVSVAPLIATSSFAGQPAPSTPPSTPTLVALVSGNKSLAVSWTETSTGSITFSATATAVGKPTRSCSSKATNCSISSLLNGVIYSVDVTAKSNAGVSSPSLPATLIVGVPSSPNSSRASAGTALATISWAPPKASGVSNITSYTATSTPGGFGCLTSSSAFAGPARTCQISGLSAGVTYSVTVTASNAYGMGVPSKAVTVTPN